MRQAKSRASYDGPNPDIAIPWGRSLSGDTIIWGETRDQMRYLDLTPEEQAEVDEWWGDLRAGYVEIEMEGVEDLSPRARQVVEEGTRRLLAALWH